MANTIKVKRSSVEGKVPTTGDLDLGELALNTYDGKLYTKKDNGTATVVEIGPADINDGDKGDITVSSNGTLWTIDDQAVAYAKIQNVSTTDRLLGRSSAGAGVIQEVACTAAGRALLDDADAAAQRTTLGLGTMATQAAASYATLASPTFTGTPAAPTAAVGTSTTQLATTAYVNAEIANDAPTKTGGGASGTWGISITGSASSATSVDDGSY
jgi:hypothetical protein